MSDPHLLFETPSLWQEEWQWMPEFVQPKIKPYAEIIVRFDSESDLREFSKLINQRLTSKTKSLRIPALILGQQSGTNLRYVDESSISNLRNK